MAARCHILVHVHQVSAPYFRLFLYTIIIGLCTGKYCRVHDSVCLCTNPANTIISCWCFGNIMQNVTKISIKTFRKYKSGQSQLRVSDVNWNVYHNVIVILFLYILKCWENLTRTCHWNISKNIFPECFNDICVTLHPQCSQNILYSHGWHIL